MFGFSTGTMMDEALVRSLRQRLQEFGQEHLLDHFDSLSEAERKTFYEELSQ